MHYGKYLAYAFSFFLVLFLFTGFTDATILRVDECGSQFTLTEGVPVIRGLPNTVVVRGDLVDTITRVDPPTGVTVTIGAKTGGGGVKTSVTLTLTPSSSVTPGKHDVKLRYLVEVSGPDVFAINVIAPKIDAITINPNDTSVTRGRLVTVTATGSGLGNVRLNSTVASDFGSFTNVSNSDTSYVFRGNLNCGGHDFTHLFTQSFHTTALPESQSCLYNTPIGDVELTLNCGVPDLVPIAAVAYRLGSQDTCGNPTILTQRDTLNQNLCNIVTAPTTTTPHVEQNVTIGPVSLTPTKGGTSTTASGGVGWGVKNASDFEVTTPFHMQIKNGNTVLQDVTVNSLAANATSSATFVRTDNIRTLVRDLNCPGLCMDKNVAPHNWVDPTFTVVVDSGGAITESGENNNSANSN
jgi:hypothetical protein